MKVVVPAAPPRHERPVVGAWFRYVPPGRRIAGFARAVPVTAAAIEAERVRIRRRLITALVKGQGGPTCLPRSRESRPDHSNEGSDSDRPPFRSSGRKREEHRAVPAELVCAGDGALG